MTNDFLKIYENGTHGSNDWKYYGDIIYAGIVVLDDPYGNDYISIKIVDPDGSEMDLLQEEIREMAQYALDHEGWTPNDVWEYEKNWFLNKLNTGIYRYVENYKYVVTAASNNGQSVTGYIENPDETMILSAAEWQLSTVALNRQGGIGGYPREIYSTEYLSGSYYGQLNGGVHVYTFDPNIEGDSSRAYFEARDYLFGDQDPEIVDPTEPEDYEDTPIMASDAYNNIIGNYLTNFTVIAEMDASNLNIIAQALNNDISGDDIVTAVIRVVRSIVQKNITEGILSIKIIPIPVGSTLPYKTGITEKLFKPLGLPNVNGKILNNTIKKYQIGSMRVHPIYKDYRDFMCEYSIYLPFSGIHRLDSDIIVGNILQIYADIDFLTGSIMYHLVVNDGATSRDIYTFTGECAIELPITGTDYSEKYQTIMNGVFSGIGMIAGGALGGPMGAGAGAALTGAAMSGLKTLGNAATVQGHYMQSGKLIPNSSVLSVLYPYLIISKPQDVSPDYKTVKGKPAHYMAKLSTLRGFSIVSNINLSGVAYATDEDKDAIKSLLASGVYF